MAKRSPEQSLQLLLSEDLTLRKQALSELSNGLRSGRTALLPDPAGLSPSQRLDLLPLWTAQRAKEGDWAAIDAVWPTLLAEEVPRVLISYGNGEDYAPVLLTHASSVEDDDVEQLFGALYAFSRWWRRGHPSRRCWLRSWLDLRTLVVLRSVQ